MKHLHITCTSVMKKIGWKQLQKYKFLYKIQQSLSTMNDLNMFIILAVTWQ
jgi:hypothetical protein